MFSDILVQSVLQNKLTQCTSNIDTLNALNVILIFNKIVQENNY